MALCSGAVVYCTVVKFNRNNFSCVEDSKVLTCTVHPGEEGQPRWLQIPSSLAASKLLLNKCQVAIDTYSCQQADGNHWSKVLFKEKENDRYYLFIYSFIYLFIYSELKNYKKGKIDQHFLRQGVMDLLGFSHSLTIRKPWAYQTVDNTSLACNLYLIKHP